MLFFQAGILRLSLRGGSDGERNILVKQVDIKRIQKSICIQFCGASASTESERSKMGGKKIFLMDYQCLILKRPVRTSLYLAIFLGYLWPSYGGNINNKTCSQTRKVCRLCLSEWVQILINNSSIIFQFVTFISIKCCFSTHETRWISNYFYMLHTFRLTPLHDGP